ncbi:RagB/SusD family nutrient uptake outer membrane protein [Belliella kenyensis]|uniref:RagB/SusD family nutrient uptake outer membrane protein n=1 Tax=Belliella kenyensis TaxID=1472724 RepID=A0ABV8ENK3_9BACT|nr:RagB/SusD family nutrient uptake outer membrane protein [Belliella kenyensis]MCH7400512.1 RagB/SusD family nutrient uptake outer membrane protein [Belliella kenyensis]MDN3604472.1 RagB/SusD family nutrient uptake outer membrane protein [Belliella kenyensis]
MKVFNKIVLGSALMIGGSFAFQSCLNLDEKVYSEVLSENFRPGERDIPAIIAPVYGSLRALMMGWQGHFDVQEESADAIVTPARPNGWYDGGTYVRMHQHTWTSLQWQPTNLWQSSYRSITTANRVIAQIEDDQISIENGREAVIAELKAVRAFAYYLLLDNHGNVPIVTDFRDISLPQQSSRTELYDFIIKEIEAALPNLSKDARNSYGQINYWVAKTLLAKIYLNAEVYTGTPQWQKVIEVCDEIIAGGAYQLDDVYAKVFHWENQNNGEIIFAVPYDEIFGQGNTVHMKTLDPLSRFVYNMQAGPWGGNCAVPQFIDTYDVEDGRLYDTWIMGPQFHANTGEMVINYTKGVPSIAATTSSQGYRIGKYQIKQGATGSLDNDFPFFRYADVLMMKAEALLRLGNGTHAAEIVSEVRARAFANTNPAKATVTAAQLEGNSRYQYGYQNLDGSIDLDTGVIPFGGFLDELGWEFAAEAHRRQDLIRFGVFQTKSWFNHRPHPQAQDKIIFPIPEAELNNNPNLTQNASY